MHGFLLMTQELIQSIHMAFLALLWVSTAFLSLSGSLQVFGLGKDTLFGSSSMSNAPVICKIQNCRRLTVSLSASQSVFPVCHSESGVRIVLARGIISCLLPSQAYSIPPSSFWEWLPVGRSVSFVLRPEVQAS